MDLGLTEDQALLAETLEHWAADHREIPAALHGEFFLPGETLAEELAANGYFDIAVQPELGALGAVLLIESVGRTPWAIEVAASALVAPMLQLSGLARPLAILNSSTAPIARFLTPGGSALIDAGDHVRLLRCDDRVKPMATRFAYPYGAFHGDALASSEALDGIRPEDLRGWRLLGTIAEAVAAMDSALNLTADHVRTRTQFGRPLGSFQAVQHRLAEVSAMLHGARLLLYRAAVDGIAHVETAAIVTHDAVQRTIYETNQFHGAIGLTLEYPLHLWAYRLRVLQFELAQAIHEADRGDRHEP
jgi:alkylation response protein AidB-like acyl-CoA dehydrogenase